ncbi:hypothetical protein HAX54_009873, partial [Datura stramonium]|nr:hypothetical protein [Datura stramonium]
KVLQFQKKPGEGSEGEVNPSDQVKQDVDADNQTNSQGPDVVQFLQKLNIRWKFQSKEQQRNLV